MNAHSDGVDVSAVFSNHDVIADVDDLAVLVDRGSVSDIVRTDEMIIFEGSVECTFISITTSNVDSLDFGVVEPGWSKNDLVSVVPSFGCILESDGSVVFLGGNLEHGSFLEFLSVDFYSATETRNGSLSELGEHWLLISFSKGYSEVIPFI